MQFFLWAKLLQSFSLYLVTPYSHQVHWLTEMINKAHAFISMKFGSAESSKTYEKKEETLRCLIRLKHLSVEFKCFTQLPHNKNQKFYVDILYVRQSESYSEYWFGQIWNEDIHKDVLDTSSWYNDLEFQVGSV